MATGAGGAAGKRRQAEPARSAGGEPGAGGERAARRGPTAQEAAWSLTEAANEPFFTLIQRHVFPPFFVGTVAADSAGPAGGAALWGYVTALAGVAVTCAAPLLGARADSAGGHRRLLVGLAVLAAAASLALWFAAPGRPVLLIAAVAAVALAATELLAVATNAFLPLVVRRSWFGLLSGLAFAFGQLAGILALLLLLALAEAPPALLAGQPHAVDRLAGPIAAAAILLFLAPGLLLFGAPAAAAGGAPPFRATLGELRSTLRLAWRDQPLRLFYLGRAIGGDGLALVFAFGAVLAAQSFGWTAAMLARLGIGVTLVSAAGGFLAAGLARALGGPRPAILLGLALALAGLLGILSAGLAAGGGGRPSPAGGFADSPPEILFLASAALVALGAGPAIAGMRALMAAIAPPGRVSACFGLFAFVGKATNFLGPLLLGLIVSATGSLPLGLAVAVPFLVGGLVCFAAMGRPARREVLDSGPRHRSPA